MCPFCALQILVLRCPHVTVPLRYRQAEYALSSSPRPATLLASSGPTSGVRNFTGVVLESFTPLFLEDTQKGDITLP